MRKTSIILSILGILLASCSLFLHFNNSEELAFVDVNVLIEKYKRTKLVRSDFQEKSKKLNSNVDSLVTSWKAEISEYEKDRSTMTDKEIKLKQELLNSKQQQINNYQKAIQEQIQQEDQKATQTLVNDVNDYVKEYGKNNNYKIILGATGNGNVMYAKDYVDLTDEILEGINSQFELD